MFRSFAQGIKNLIRWLPIIWKDRQFDHGYLFDILRHKLILMDEFWQSDQPMCVKQPYVLKDIHIARLLADRICDMDYIGNALTDVDRKHKKAVISWEQDDENPNYRIMRIDESPEAREARLRAYSLSDYLKKQDIKMLFGIMSKKIESWWD